MGDDDQTLNFFHLSLYSPASFQTTPEDPIIKRVETVGKIFPHVTAKIVDTDGNIVPRGTPGEVLVKGYLVQKGYDCFPFQVIFVHSLEMGVNLYRLDIGKTRIRRGL